MVIFHSKLLVDQRVKHPVPHRAAATSHRRQRKADGSKGLQPVVAKAHVANGSRGMHRVPG